MRKELLALAVAALLGAAACSDDGGGPDAGPDTGGTCSPANCQGCCLGNECKTGDEASACGSAGLACISCPDGEACLTGQCVVASGKCNINNCPDGCCQGDQCLPGNTDEACGKGGRVCSACGSSSKCIDGRCDCDPATCPGCCEARKCNPGTDRQACGKGGITCAQCKSDEICSSSTRTCTKTSGCDPSKCSGCCQGPECKSGNADSACGKNGQGCAVCKSNESCQSGVCNDPSACGPGNCNGCCAGSACLSGSTAKSCGGGGGLCETCADYQKCSGASGCEVDNDRLWGITVLKATIDSSKNWDAWPANVAPDVYVEIEIDTLTAKTSKIDNEYAPVWNEYVGKVKAGVLLNLPIKVKVLDSDAIGAETIGACNITVPLNVLVSGNNAVVSDCGGPDVQKIYFKFTLQ